MVVDKIYDKDKYCISLFKNLPDAILIIDGNLIIDCNNAAVKIFGYNSKDELIGLNPYELSPEKQPNREPSSEMEKKMIDIVLKKGSTMFEWRHRKKDDTEFYAEVVLVAISTNEKNIVAAIIRDITIRKKIQILLEEKEKMYNSIFHNNHAIMLLIDPNTGQIKDANPAACSFYGYSKTQITNIKIIDINCLSKEEIFLEMQNAKLENRNHFIFPHKLANGERREVEVYSGPININNQKLLYSIIYDITEKKEALGKLKESENKIKNLAIRDKLTGIYNRSFFVSRLSSEIEKAQETSQNLAILFINVDGFKSINDNLGHISGDQALQTIAERIKKCMDGKDIVARVGGDEFVILLSNIKQRYDIVKKVEKIMNRFEKPIYMLEFKFYISVSIGIAVYPFNGQSTEELIKNADIAMHKAKKYSGNRYEYYTSSLHKKAREEFIIENGLRKALERDEFSVYYQPIMDLQTKELVGAEALIRWKHQKYGNIPPNKFIPIAETRGFIGYIGEWVLRKACLENKRWQEIGLKPIFIAVNISVRQLEQYDFIDTVKKILSETKLDPKYLELEITESISIENVKDNVSILKKLKDLGLRLSLDDFGTGFSSLSQLKKLCISKLKIDRSFINDINTDSNNTAIVSTIIAIAKKLNLNVVAEGVETKEQLDFLNMEKCDMVQGYFYSPPVPPNSFEKLFMNFANSNK